MRRFPKNSFSHTATDYAKRVISGKIAACWQVKAACQRFIDDFERTDIIFDTARVDDICNFAQAMPHVIGPLAGETIRLEPFQIFILANLFGWLDPETRLRRYREAFILLPRGNAKSTLAAIIALHMTFREGQGGAEGLSGATSLDQANAVFTPAKRMVEMTPAFAEALGIETAARSIYQPSTGSSFKPVIANTKDGGLPWIAVADELHQAINENQLAAFRTGMGKRRGADPLLIIVSTAGTNTAGVCRQEQLYFEAVLTCTITDDAKFALIYTIDPNDDWMDFRVWAKANPNYGVSVDEAHLRREYEKALQSPSAQAMALTKYLNVWTSSSNGWLNQKDWLDAADPTLTIPVDAPAYIGGDLSTKSDLTAITLVATLPDGRKAVQPHIFAPEGALERSKNAKAYQEWRGNGAMTITEGEASDFAVVEQKIRDLCHDYNVQAVMLDQWQAAQLSQRLMADGITVIEFPQNLRTYTPAMVDFEADLMNGNIVHPGNPCLNWMAQNVVACRKGNLMKPDKPTGQDHLKIDGIAAMLMAYAKTQEPMPEKIELECEWFD